MDQVFHGIFRGYGSALSGLKRVGIACLLLAITCEAARAADVRWVGPANGQWHNATNWSGGEVPGVMDNVTVSGAVAVSINDAREVGGVFVLEENALLLVSGAEASFHASGVTRISNGRVSVMNGAVAAFPEATDYAWTLCEQALLFQCDGTDSLLDLSGLQSIVMDAPDCENLLQSVIASAGGVIDFGSLESISAAESQQLSLSWLTGAAIEMPKVAAMDRAFLLLGEDTMTALPALTGLTNSTLMVSEGGFLSANTLVEATDCVLSIGGSDSAEFARLDTLTSCLLTLSSAGELALPLLTTIRNSTVLIGDGTSLSLPRLVTLESTDGLDSFSTVGSGAVSAPMLTSVRNIAFVTSLGSALRLPSVETLHWDRCEGGAFFTTGTEASMDFSGLRTITVENTGCTGLGYSIGATGGSTIDLSALTTLTTPAGQFVTVLASNAETVVDVSSLVGFNPLTVTFLETDGGRILRSGSGGEGEGEGGVSGCPSPASGRAARATVLGDITLLLAAAGLLGFIRRR